MKPPYDEGDCLASCSLDELEDLFPSQPRRKNPVVKGTPARCSDDGADCVMVVSFFWATVGWRFGCNLYTHPLYITFHTPYVWFDAIDPTPCSDQPPTLARCTHPLVAGTDCTTGARAPHPTPPIESPDSP